jgi:hypothetical protein
MPAFDGTLARWFHDHHGIAGTAALSQLGLSPDQRQRLVHEGVFDVLFEGVYHLMSTPLDFEGRCAAVCAADPSLVLSCFTAGRLAGLRRCGSEFIHAMTDRITKPVGPRVKLHRTRVLPDEHIVARPDGIRLTTPERTFFDLAKHVSDLTLISVGEQIIKEGLATYESLAATARSLSSRGRPGSGRALRVLDSRSPVGAAAESHDEVRLLDALHRVGLRGFVRHPPVTLLNGRVIHPDLGDPRVGFYVEVDHHTWHDQSVAIDTDNERDLQIRLVGGEVERVTNTRLAADLARVVADIRHLYSRRIAQVGGESGRRPA